MADQQKPQIIDNPAANEIYTNKIIGSSYDGATISLTLGCTRVVPERLETQPTPVPAVYVAARLSLTPAAAAELVNTLNSMLGAIAKGHGKTN